MVKHSLLKEETAKAKEPITKTRNKRYTKTRPKKSSTQEPALPQPKWWQRNSIYRLLCCQNACYSTILYIVLVILLAMFAYAAWRICNSYLISKSHNPVKGSHGWKNHTANNNNDVDSQITEEDGSGYKDHLENHRHKQNTFKKLLHNSPGRSNHRKFQSNVLPKDELSHLKNHVPSSPITSHDHDNHPSSSTNPGDIPGDKRYIIPPSPTRFKAQDGLDGSGASEVEEWRAIRYNLLKNRLQLTTGTSFPTESPYWKAWFLSRNNPSSERPFAGSGISPVHDDNYKNYNSISHLLESIPSVIVRNPEEKRPLAKHSDIQGANKNSTMPNAYSKLLQDLFDKISAMRQVHTTVRQTKPSIGVNATLLQLKILSALVNKGIQVKPSDSSPKNANAVGKVATVRPYIAASSDTSVRSTTTPTTKTTTLSTTTKPTTTTEKAATTTNATTMATTVTKTTAATKATSKATTATTTLKNTTQDTTATTGRTVHRNTHSRSKHNRKKRRKLRHKSTRGSKARHHNHHHHHHHTYERSKHHKKSHIKEPASYLSTGAIDFGSGSGDAESGSGSGSGDGESGSGIEEPRSERKKDDKSKAFGKSHQKLQKYVGLRERIKRLKHGKKLKKRLNKHNLHHVSSRRKGKRKDFNGKARSVISNAKKRHSKGNKKTHRHKQNHHERKHKGKNDGKRRTKKSRKTNKHKFMKIIQRKISRMKKKNQIASRLKHVQNKMKEVMKRKKRKKKSYRHQKRNKIEKAGRDQVKLLNKPIKRREEPKHWHKGHLSMARCVTLKEFDHHHYVGLTKLWKAGKKNTFALTECKRKGKHSNHFKCRRTFYRTRGQMGLKSKRSGKRGKLSLIVCRKKHELKRSLKDDAKQERKVSITYAKVKKKKKKRHHKAVKRNHRHKKKRHHGDQSSTKRHSIYRQRRNRSHNHRRFSRKHRISHHRFHKRRLRKKKHHKSIWSDIRDDDNNDGNGDDDDDYDDFGTNDREEDNDDGNGNSSGSGDDSSGDEEERVERSTNVSNLSHSRSHGRKNHHRRHNHHNHNHHHHHQHRRHTVLKHSIGKANLTNETSLISYSNNNNNSNSQIFTEFVDLMKEMKQEIQNVTVLSTNNHNVKLKDSTANSSHPTIKALKLSNQTTPVHPFKAKPTLPDSVRNVSASNSSLNSAINPGMVHDMVAQIVPAIMKQFEVKSIVMPTNANKDKTTTTTNSKDKVATAATIAMQGKMTSAKAIKMTTKVTPRTTKRPTTLKTTKARPTPHPTNRHFTTPKHMTVTQHHSTKRKSQPHPKTTAGPNLALILKGLKALGVASIGQHASTGKPSQAQKKSVTPSALDNARSTLKAAPAPPKHPQLPPPIPKPLQLHNRFSMNILCFGDSLTAGYHNHGKAFTPYGNHLRQLLTYSSRIPVNLKIKGIVGEMTHKQMVSRLPEILGNNSAFDWVIILGGTNDILHVKNFADDQEFLGQLESVWQPRITKDIEKLHTIAHNHNAHTMLLTIPENAIEAWPGYKILLTMRTKINDALRKYANGNRNNVALCDLAKTIPRHSLTPQQEALFWDDHLHMTPQGYNRMAEEVFKCLKPYIPNNPTTI